MEEGEEEKEVEVLEDPLSLGSGVPEGEEDTLGEALG